MPTFVPFSSTLHSLSPFTLSNTHSVGGMSHPPPPSPPKPPAAPPLSLPILFSLLLSLLPSLPALPILPNPDPVTIQQQQPFHPTPSPPATIPSSPEQSDVAGCPLRLPAAFFPAVKSSCVKSGDQLRRDKCCPVLAAWLFSSYSATALGGGAEQQKKKRNEQTTTYDMPLLPDDSETCVDGLEKAMREKGVELVRPNATCDVVYCYCGIRLHPLSCPQSFWVSDGGELVGDERVKRLERDCLSGNGNGNATDGSHGYSELKRCSKCLDSLYMLKKGGNGKGNATKSEARTSKMRSRDCELMGLTWLLNKNRDAYISTVTAVIRALIMNAEDSDPQSCSLSSDGMPLAVDSIDINGQSSSVVLQFSIYLYSFALFLLIMSPNLLPYCF